MIDFPHHSALKSSRRAFFGGLTASTALLTGCGLFRDKPKPPIPGHRVDVLSGGAGLVVDKSDHTPINLPPSENISSWAQAHRIPSHEAVNAQWASDHLAWSRSIGAGISEPAFLHFAALGPNGRGAIQSPPMIAGGMIYTRDAIGTVRAWAWPGMTFKWRFVPKGRKSRSTDIGGGLGIADGVLFIVDGVGQVIALDAASGTEKWRSDIGVPGRSSPTIMDGRVFFGTIDERLFALDAQTGRQLWSYQATPAETVMFGQPAPAIVNGIVVAGFGSGDLVALRAESGELVWSDSLGGSNGQGAILDLACVRGAPVITHQTAYAVSLSKVLVAIDMRSGRRLWEREVSGQNTPLIVDDWLYVISSDQQIACIDRQSGHVRWSQNLRRFQNEVKDKDAITWFGPIMAEGKLVCVSSFKDAGMAVVDAGTGKILSVTKTSSPTLIEPIICDGKLLVLSVDGNLNAYG